MSRTVVLGVCSDLHAGSTVALVPKGGVSVIDGGTYTPSTAQQWLWDHWEAAWLKHARGVIERESRLADVDFGVVVNGDATDGNHHGTVQILSGAEGVHIKVATECLRVPLSLNPKWMWVVKGTEAHVGKSGGLEDAVAVALDREGAPVQKDPETHSWTWWHLTAEINGRLLDFTHHGRMGQRAHTRAGYSRHFAFDVWAERAMYGDRAPDLAVRSHYHKFMDSGIGHPLSKVTRVIQTPAWQLATAFVRRVAPESLADIGLVVIVIRADGTIIVEPYLAQPDRGPVWRP